MELEWTRRISHKIKIKKKRDRIDVYKGRSAARLLKNGGRWAGNISLETFNVGDTTLLLIVINEKDISTGRCNPVPMEFFVDIRQREIFLPVVRVHANICVQISPDETLHVVRRGIVGRTNRSSRYPRNLVTRISKRSPKSCKKIDRLLFFQLGNGIEEKFAKILNYSFSEWMNEWISIERMERKKTLNSICRKLK